MKQFLVIPVLLASTTAAHAQLEWLRYDAQTSIGVEYLQPSFADNGYSKATGSIVLVTARIALSERTRILLELPYASTTEEYRYSNYLYDYATNTYIPSVITHTEKKSGVGNLAVGLEFGSNDISSSGHLVAFVPTMSEDNSFAGYSGILGDFPHFERYSTESWILAAGYEYHPLFENGLVLSVNLEPSVWVPTQGRDEVEAILDYGGSVGFQSGILKIGLGLGSRWIVTEDHFFGRKNSLHHVTAEVSVRFGIIQPGITFLRQLDKELNTSVKNTLGVHVRFLL